MVIGRRGGSVLEVLAASVDASAGISAAAAADAASVDDEASVATSVDVVDCGPATVVSPSLVGPSQAASEKTINERMQSAVPMIV